MDDDQPEGPPPILVKAGAVATALAGLALIAIAIDTLRPRRDRQEADDE